MATPGIYAAFMGAVRPVLPNVLISTPHENTLTIPTLQVWRISLGSAKSLAGVHVVKKQCLRDLGIFCLLPNLGVEAFKHQGSVASTREEQT